MPALQAWYASVQGVVEGAKDPEMRRFYVRMIRKEQHRDAVSEFAKLTHGGKGVPHITEDPPLIYHIEEENDPQFWVIVRHVLERYRESLPADRRVLFDRFRFRDRR